MSAISTHVLDTARGCPAAGVPITLEVQRAGQWHRLGAGVTDDDGRLRTLLGSAALEATTYRLSFDTAAYAAAHGAPCFFPSVDIVFAVFDAHQHHHVPLLLSPFSYSTYRGS
jgi:5-hydroxyisourate hydrolase